jgi:hypothetical protein
MALPRGRGYSWINLVIQDLAAVRLTTRAIAFERFVGLARCP